MKEYYIYDNPFNDPVYLVTAKSLDEAFNKVKKLNPNYCKGSVKGGSLIDLYLQDKNAKQYINIVIMRCENGGK